MKILSIFIYCLILSFSSLLANEKESFVQKNADFHTINIEQLKDNKTSGKCFSCHLFDKKLDSVSQWLTPQKSLDAEIQNLDTSNGDPDQFSRTCLMCHDGNEASLVLNAPLSPCGLKSLVPISPNGANHPVFVKYPNKRDYHNPSSTLNGIWNEATQVSDLLRDEKVVCISCHIPHHSKEIGFLRTSMRGSGLCMGCHKK